MHNKDMQWQRILRQKANIKEEIENTGIIELTNYVRRTKIDNKYSSVNNIKIQI